MQSNKLSRSLIWICGLVVCGAFLIGLAPPVHANPPNIPDGWKLEYKFNLIGYPEGHEYNGGCGEGRRIFVNRDAHHAHIWIVDGFGWEILDCNATADNRAKLQTDDSAIYHLFIKMLGKPGGSLDICVDTMVDHEEGGDDAHMCYVGEVHLERSGKDKFVMQPINIYDASLEDLIWNIDTNGDFRIAQFRIYKEE